MEGPLTVLILLALAAGFVVFATGAFVVVATLINEFSCALDDIRKGK